MLANTHNAQKAFLVNLSDDGKVKMRGLIPTKHGLLGAESTISSFDDHSSDRRKPIFKRRRSEKKRGTGLLNLHRHDKIGYCWNLYRTGCKTLYEGFSCGSKSEPTSSQCKNADLINLLHKKAKKVAKRSGSNTAATIVLLNLDEGLDELDLSGGSDSQSAASGASS